MSGRRSRHLSPLIVAGLRRRHAGRQGERVRLPSSPIASILVAKGLRSFGDGFVSLLLPLYLLDLGYGPLQVGVLATATLLGSGVMTLGVGLHAHRWHYRTLLLAAAAAMAATGVGFAFVRDFWPLMVIAVAGTLNPSSGDVSVFLPLEHAALSRLARDARRTALFARYSLVGSLCAALGSLAVAVPPALVGSLGISARASLQSMFIVYALIAVLVALVYRRLPRSQSTDAPAASTPLQASKRRVYVLAALFSVDAFGGGFVAQSLIALWLFQRFGVSLEWVGTVFFWTGLLTAASYIVAVRIAEKIGLVNTMVFTHLPSSLCLIAIPFVPHLGLVVALLLVRSALSPLDVPTRSSYVMAIVSPDERPAAASVTTVPRSLASAASPVIAGYLLSVSTFGWPLIAAGSLKIVYDLLLLAFFRNVRPPEEAQRRAPSSGKP
jgi:MFS family permease